MNEVGVLFVCMGNICRSPAAQGVFESLWRQAALDVPIRVDSAGTHAYHVGEPPDSRMQAAAMRRGYDLSAQRARRFEPEDAVRFDYILAMDQSNLDALRQQIMGAGAAASINLLMSYAPERGVIEVPDPYYGGSEGFEHVLDLVEEACSGLIEAIGQTASHN